MSMKKIHRFIEDYEIENGNIVLKNETIIHQFRNVLKFKVGEEIIIASNNKEILGKILKIGKKEVIILKIKEYINSKEPTKNIHLYLAILKKENFELAVEKATEIGVKKITPLLTERTIKMGLNIERLKKIAKEASELSGRSIIPEIKEIKDLKSAINEANGEIIIFDIDGENLEKINNKEISIFIGPEGGFSQNELSLIKDKKLKIATMSTLTLRGETAAIIASYIAINN